MHFKIKKFYKIFFISILFFNISCSKNFENSPVILTFPKNIAKIEGNHALLIRDNIFNLKKNISSDDCESWALDLNLEDLFLDTYIDLSKKMFENIKVIKGEFSESLLKKNTYNSLLILERNTAYLDFKTEGNNGLFKIILDSNFRVKGNKKEVKTNLNSNQTWKKNIYLNCRLSEGSRRATEQAFKHLIDQAYSNIYDSVFTVTR